MKTLGSTILIATLLLSGCTEKSEFESKSATASASASNINIISPIHSSETKTNSATADNQREETMFLNNNVGWKAVYHFQGMFREDMELYTTSNGGAAWKQISNSKQEGSTLPGGVKAGFIFYSETEGWIATNAPWDGKVGLFKTNDGGVTWSEQIIKVPSVLVSSQIITVPPLFFTKDKGILVTRPVSEEHSLLYVTSDGGQSWKSFLDNGDDQYLGIEWTLSEGVASVKYGKEIWTINIQNLGKWSLQS